MIKTMINSPGLSRIIFQYQCLSSHCALHWWSDVKYFPPALSWARDLDNIIQSVLMRILLLLSGFSEITTFIFTASTQKILSEHNVEIVSGEENSSAAWTFCLLLREMIDCLSEADTLNPPSQTHQMLDCLQVQAPLFVLTSLNGNIISNTGSI